MYAGELSPGDLVRVRLDGKVRHLASHGGAGPVPELLDCRIVRQDLAMSIGEYVVVCPTGRLSIYWLSVSRKSILEKLVPDDLVILEGVP